MSKLKKFKLRLKRFVLVLPVIVCLVFSFVPLCVNAEISGRPPYFPDLNDSISWAGGENYLIFQGIQTSGSATYACSYVFHFNGDNGYYSISENDTSYTLSYNYSDGRPTSCPMLFCYYIWGKDDSNEWYLRNESLQNYPDKCKSFTFDYSTNKLTVTESDGDINTIFDCFIYTDIKEFNPNALNVDVSFSPALSGEVDRSFVNNGKTYYDKSFEMTVTNNSSKAIQYRMFIQEGELRAPSVVQQFKADLVFYYMSVNWVYSGDVKSGSSVSDYVEKQLKPTNWMYCASGESNSHLVNWNQVNLKQGQKYSVFVQAVLTDETVATEVFTSGARHSVSLSDAEYVFGSEFSVKYLGDVSFDASCSDNGIVPLTSDRDLAEQLYTRYAYFDPTKPALNNTVYDEYHALSDSDSWYYDEDKDTNPWGQPILVGGDSYSNQSNDINNFMTSSSSYLRFLSSVYGFFPVPVWTAISCGIFLIVIIGIVKRLG